MFIITNIPPDISIHAPREGGDFKIHCYHLTSRISIHAPREGGDQYGAYLTNLNDDFNPRPPRGGATSTCSISRMTAVFQSTPPARGATASYQT